MSDTVNRNGRRPARLAAAVALAAVLAAATGCSSAPQGTGEVVARKNEAADFSKLADGFFFEGQYASALQYYGEALDANLAVDNMEGAIGARNSLGRTYLALGRLDDAARELGDALEDARAAGLPGSIALSLSNLGELRYARGDADGAVALFEEAAAVVSPKDPTSAVISHNRGVIALARGDLDSAEAFLLAAAKVNEKEKRWIELATNRYVLAAVFNARGDLDGAIAWAYRALAADKAAENTLGIGADLEAAAKLQRKAGRADLAFDLYRRAFGLWLAANREQDAIRCLNALSVLAGELDKEDYLKRYTAILDSLKAEE